MDTSKHFKLYKSGKKWCVMAIAALAMVVGMSTTANADETSGSTSASDNTTELTTQATDQVTSDTATLNSDQDSSKDSSQDSSSLSEQKIDDNSTSTSESEEVSTANTNQVTLSTQAVNTLSSQELDTSLVATTTKNGWVNENGSWTYYTNGSVASGRSYSYLPTINGTGHNWYLVDNGVAQSKVQKWAGTYYYFDPTTYLRVDNDYVKSQWGDWYLFGSDGRIQTKVQKWAGTYYYFDPVTYLRVDNDYRQSQWGDWYMFGKDGRIVTKVYQWAGTYYYFDPVTYLRVDNDYRQSQWGDWYMFGSDGRIVSGLKKWYGNYYYFDPTTYLKVTNKTFTVDGMSLHADASGIVTGATSQSTFLLSIYEAALDGWRQYGVLPSVTAAQAILESAWGKSALATQGHNLFGIKGSYNGQSIVMRTAEYGSNGYYYINDSFRKYPSNYESVVDHGRFLATNSRYSNLLWKTDYATVTNYLKQDGYATDPNYPSSLNNVIRTYGLQAWDKRVL